WFSPHKHARLHTKAGVLLSDLAPDAMEAGCMADISSRAAALHAASIVIDAHSDILMGLTDGTADWDDGPQTGETDGGCDGQVSLRLLRNGGVTAQVFALFTAPFGLDYRVVRPEFAGATQPRALAMAATFHEAL